ncbi:MAG: response regulator [Pseudomonadota bacterium]
MQTLGTQGAGTASYDWSETDLGDFALWPHTLRLTVDILLASPQPTLLVWGARRVVIYNDAYAALAGPHHAPAPGGGVPALWPAALDATIDALEAAWQGEASVQQARRLAVGPGRADAVFDLCFTPIADESGQVHGVLCAFGAQAADLNDAAGGAPLRVLVVEDNPDAQYLLCEMLCALGHASEGVASGEQALAILAHKSFDVLFTDVSLPGISGIELARRALRVQPGLQIVFASGYGELTQEQAGIPCTTLKKPYELEQLQAALAAVAARLRRR